MDPKEIKVYTGFLISGLLVLCLFFFAGWWLMRKNTLERRKKEISYNKELMVLDEERFRFSSDLHDELGPVLSATWNLLIDIHGSSEWEAELVEQARMNMKMALNSMDAIAHNLRASKLLEKGLRQALEALTEQISSTGKVRFRFRYGVQTNLPVSVKTELYRIVQEVIRNALKHSKAGFIEIDIREVHGALHLRLRDNGQGFDTDAAAKARGLGLENLRHRVSTLYGKIGTAFNGSELIEKVKALQPDVVVTDIRMPKMNGIDAMRELLTIYPDLAVVGLTQFEDDDLIVEMLENGARGFILKKNYVDELVKAVETVYRGDNYFCNGTSLRLSKSIASSRARISKMEKESFSEKELEIMRLVCQQHSTKEIAPLVHLSETTVERYRTIIMNKIGAENVVGIVVYAIRNGIYKP